MKRTVLFLALCTVAGCGGAPASTDDAVYTRTIVHFRADGTQAVTTEPVTASQQAREVAARRAAQQSPGGVRSLSQAISQDYSCGGADIWVFDQAYFAGNEICFFGAGNAVLANFVRSCPLGQLCTHWNSAARSYWAGTEDGYFYSAAGGDPCHETFTEGEEKFVAGWCAQNSTDLILTD